MSIEPFSINVPQAKLDRLQAKLELADLPDEVEGSGWNRGSPLADIQRLTKYWRENYDWRQAEAHLNKFPQFITPINVEGFGTFKIHFIHQPSSVKGAIPLLFAHGWPGSFDEVTKILPELVKGGSGKPAFHVVAPSLVNFGFSDGCSKSGFTTRRHAEVCHKLMLKLGYNQYATQGGDVGYGVTRFMGFDYPESCRASHVNFPRPNPPGISAGDLFYKDQSTPRTEAEKAGLARTKWFMTEGIGYNTEQSTKPQTIGYSLLDSPVGLLAWIYEKLHDWTDGYPWTEDEILTWISIYYFSTAGPHASVRVYYESKHNHDADTQTIQSGYVDDVKLGVTKFPKELHVLPSLWSEQLGHVVFQKEYEVGGHFAAWERPDALVNDLREMFGRGGGAFGIVEGRTGYDE